jgi:hypothetical protein
MSGFSHPHCDPKEHDEAMRTLGLLADQVGVNCADCGALILGCQAIGAVSYMAPFGSDDYLARAYCLRCAEQLRGDDAPGSSEEPTP